MAERGPRACIIGHPVGHSRSPLIHGHWLRAYGIAGEYGRQDVAPADLPAFLGALAERGYVGGNVTVPHKEAAFAAVAVDDPVARALGAVNTLWLEGVVVRGANTDMEGFLANLDHAAPGWDADLARVAVLGAGGAASAVVYGLLARGAGEIALVNRTLGRAAGLAARFDAARVRPVAWTDAAAAMAGAALLVNTTSLGMAGQPPLDCDLAALPRGALVTDIVYVPLVTPLLAAARARGNPVVDGLGMLLHQAVPGFERWFGVRPVVTPALRDLVIADMRGG